MDIFLEQVVADGTPDLLMSQNKIRAMRLLLCLWKIQIDAEFVLSSVGQRIYIKGRRIVEQESVYYRLVR